RLAVDPVVLAAAIVVRLQGVVAREVAPDEFAVVTVGSLRAGAKANIIPASAELLVNVRAYDLEVRARLLAAIERIVRAECVASAAPRPPEPEVNDSYPLTDNDTAITERVTAAFVESHGAELASRLAPATASNHISV